MNNKWHRLRTIIFIMLFLFHSVGAFAETGLNRKSFSLDTLDPSLSLAEALVQYPEIKNIYCFQDISLEEAEAAIRDGMPVYDGTECSAIEILSQINSRKEQCSEADVNAIEKPGLASRGPYGSAWPYRSKTGEQPNCYGYAVGIDLARDPGHGVTNLEKALPSFLAVSHLILPTGI